MVYHLNLSYSCRLTFKILGLLCNGVVVLSIIDVSVIRYFQNCVKKALELVDFVYYSMISPLLIMIVWVMSYEFLFMKSYTLELED